jgi:hypothetical protein
VKNEFFPKFDDTEWFVMFVENLWIPATLKRSVDVVLENRIGILSLDTFLLWIFIELNSLSTLKIGEKPKMPPSLLFLDEDLGSLQFLFTIFFSTMLGCFQNPSSFLFRQVYIVILVMQIFITLTEKCAICTGFSQISHPLFYIN